MSAGTRRWKTPQIVSATVTATVITSSQSAP